MSAASAPGTSESPHVRPTLARKVEPTTPERLTGAPTNETPWGDIDERLLTRRRHLMRHVTLRPVDALLHVTT
jgi:hypothetical protein